MIIIRRRMVAALYILKVPAACMNIAHACAAVRTKLNVVYAQQIHLTRFRALRCCAYSFYWYQS
jgi:hypothetical protein